MGCSTGDVLMRATLSGGPQQSIPWKWSVPSTASKNWDILNYQKFWPLVLILETIILPQFHLQDSSWTELVFTKRIEAFEPDSYLNWGHLWVVLEYTGTVDVQFVTTLTVLYTTRVVQIDLKRSENQIHKLLTCVSEIALSIQTALPWQSLHSGGTSSGHSLMGQLFVSGLNSSHFFPSAAHFLLQGLYCCSVSTSFSAFLKPKSEGHYLVICRKESKAALIIWE